MPLLSDFGEARLGDVHNGLIQPDIYRAPEVILGMSWTSKVDIWNVGALVCEGQHFLFYCSVCHEELLTKDSFGIYLKITICSMVEDPTGNTRTHIFSPKW